MTWQSIRKGSIIEINSHTNGKIIVKVHSRAKSFGYGKIVLGKRKYSSSKHYMFNEQMFNKGKITLLRSKSVKALYGD